MVSRYMKKKPCNLTLVNNSDSAIQRKRSVGEDVRTAASSGQSSPSLQSPFRMTCRSPGNEFLPERKGEISLFIFQRMMLCKILYVVQL